MYERLITVKNKRLVQQLHPYAHDLNDTVNLLKTYSKYLGTYHHFYGQNYCIHFETYKIYETLCLQLPHIRSCRYLLQFNSTKSNRGLIQNESLNN